MTPCFPCRQPLAPFRTYPSDAHKTWKSVIFDHPSTCPRVPPFVVRDALRILQRKEPFSQSLQGTDADRPGVRTVIGSGVLPILPVLLGSTGYSERIDAFTPQ